MRNRFGWTSLDDEYDAFLSWMEALPDSLMLTHLVAWVDNVHHITGRVTTAHNDRATIIWHGYAAFEEWMLAKHWPVEVDKLRKEFNDAATDADVYGSEAPN